MDSGYAVVEDRHHLVVHVDVSLAVEHVYLRTEHQFDAIHMAGHHMEIAEVYRGASARYSGGVLGDAEELEAFLGGCPRHFLEGRESVTGGHGVGMYV